MALRCQSTQMSDYWLSGEVGTDMQYMRNVGAVVDFGENTIECVCTRRLTADRYRASNA